MSAWNQGPRERGTLNPPSKPPSTSWWLAAPRDQWRAIVTKEAERMRGSKEEADYVQRLT